jgi:hypothetical protein
MVCRSCSEHLGIGALLGIAASFPVMPKRISYSLDLCN